MEDDAVKRRPLHEQLLINRSSQPPLSVLGGGGGGNRFQTLFEYPSPSEVVGINKSSEVFLQQPPLHQQHQQLYKPQQPSTAVELLQIKNQYLYSHQERYQQPEYFFGTPYFENPHNIDAAGGDSSSFLPTYDSIFGQFKDEDDGKSKKSDSWFHLKTVLSMFLAKREFKYPFAILSNFAAKYRLSFKFYIILHLSEHISIGI